MGRWTPLILMAGGLAILLGTLLGINFPMGVQTANAPGGKAAKVLQLISMLIAVQAARMKKLPLKEMKQLKQTKQAQYCTPKTW